MIRGRNGEGKIMEYRGREGEGWKGKRNREERAGRNREVERVGGGGGMEKKEEEY
jgi:hypothetical protein